MPTIHAQSADPSREFPDTYDPDAPENQYFIAWPEGYQAPPGWWNIPYSEMALSQREPFKFLRPYVPRWSGSIIPASQQDSNPITRAAMATQGMTVEDPTGGAYGGGPYEGWGGVPWPVKARWEAELHPKGFVAMGNLGSRRRPLLAVLVAGAVWWFLIRRK